MRTSEIKRSTAETQIELKLNLDGTGKYEIDTGCGFLDHMLVLFARHGRFDLTVKCNGDINVDYHHTVEDIGIVLGQAFAEALGNMAGIKRYGDIILPMDESLIMCAVDISGRAHLSLDLGTMPPKVGDFDTELVSEFLLGFVRNSKMTLHVNKLYGTNTHHIIEGSFKALGRVLSQAVSIDEKYIDEIPSTKGVL